MTTIVYRSGIVDREFNKKIEVGGAIFFIAGSVNDCKVLIDAYLDLSKVLVPGIHL